MCVTIIVDDNEVSSVAELRKSVPVVVIPDEDSMRATAANQGGDIENGCLCVVDIDATAKANGRTIKENCSADPMVYWFA